MGVVAPSLDQACLSYVFKRITLNCSKARTRVIFDKLEIVKYRRRRRLLNLSWLQEVETVQKDEFPLANSYNLKDLKLNDLFAHCLQEPTTRLDALRLLPHIKTLQKRHHANNIGSFQTYEAIDWGWDPYVGPKEDLSPRLTNRPKPASKLV